MQQSTYRELFLTESENTRKRYKELLFKYIQIMENTDRHIEVIDACRKASDCFPFDTELNEKLQQALGKVGEMASTKEYYKHIVRLNHGYNSSVSNKAYTPYLLKTTLKIANPIP